MRTSSVVVTVLISSLHEVLDLVQGQLTSCRGLDLGGPTVHEEFGSCHVTTLVGRKEHHGLRDLNWCTGTSERCRRRRLCDEGLDLLVGHSQFGLVRRCDDCAGADHIHTDVFPAEVYRP